MINYCKTICNVIQGLGLVLIIRLNYTYRGSNTLIFYSLYLFTFLIYKLNLKVGFGKTTGLFQLRTRRISFTQCLGIIKSHKNSCSQQYCMREHETPIDDVISNTKHVIYQLGTKCTHCTVYSTSEQTAIDYLVYDRSICILC